MTTAHDLPRPLAEHLGTLEEALHTHVDRSSASGLPLYRMMAYQLGWVDRDGAALPPSSPARFHGALCLEAGSTFAGASDHASPALTASAAGVELLHESFTVHEEMQNASGQADDHPAVWWVWGPAQAINVGDGLHALARLAVFRMQEQSASTELTLAAVGALDTLALRYYEGQYLDLTYQERIDVTEAQYASLVEAKRGALIGGAAALGALAAGAGDSAVTAFLAFGERLGAAAQMQEDIDAIWEDDGGRAGRFLNKSKLYPVVHVLEHGSLKQKRALGNVYFKRVMEPSDLEAVRAVLEDAGSREYCATRAAAMRDEALANLEGAGIDNDAKARWHEIAHSLV